MKPIRGIGKQKVKMAQRTSYDNEMSKPESGMYEEQKLDE